MRGLFYLAIIAAAVYGIVVYVPAETKERALAAVGLSGFFEETLPGYLRSKFSIPENPVAKREKLLNELSAAIGNIGEELESVAPLAVPAPPAAGGKSKTAEAPKAAPPELRERIEKTKELVRETESLLADLEKANPEQGFVAKAAERVLDKILPPPVTFASADAAPGGVGGDAGGGSAVVCP